MRSVLVLLVTLLPPPAVAQDLVEDPPPPPPVWREILELRGRLEALEAREGERAPSGEPVAIDLSGDEVDTLATSSDHVLARPWYQNVALSGYGALAYLDSGGAGTTEHGSFVVKEASLFLDARVWERATLFTEVWLARYQYGSGFSLNEVYLQLDDLFARDGREGVGLRVGKMEIPFGEEYLRWDANETPLVTFSAADPYGTDEGVEMYGALGPLRWVGAVMNGSSGPGPEDGQGKLVAAKLYDEPHPDFYWSASALATGRGASSALRLGGSTITPVGAEAASSAGVSPSNEVESTCFELDARVASSRTLRSIFQVGGARIDDDESAFDRDLAWFLVEPALRLRHDLDLVVRWSRIGTDDHDEGYRFAGKIVADAEAFGYDTRSLERISVGLCWKVHPRLALKAEVGRDHIDLIDASLLDADNHERTFFALELVGSF